MLKLKKDTADDVLTIFIAILMFQSLPRFQFVGGYIEKYPIIIFGIALILLFKRKAIIDAIAE